MMWWNEGTGVGGWAVMTVAMLVLWSLLVLGAVMLVRGLAFDGSGRAGGRPDPMKLLDERFARGELDVEEYRARKDVLRGRR